MESTDDVTPSEPTFVDHLSPSDFGLSSVDWVVEVWSDLVAWRHADNSDRSVCEFPEYPDEFFVGTFGIGMFIEDLVGPFPNLATAVAFFEMTKT